MAFPLGRARNGSFQFQAAVERWMEGESKSQASGPVSGQGRRTKDEGTVSRTAAQSRKSNLFRIAVFNHIFHFVQQQRQPKTAATIFIPISMAI